jgi:alanyl-tRNA synthetase
MKSSEIRKAFLEYFRQNGHEVVRSAPLIPPNDPTLLFTNAGMVQFKSVFLGEEAREHARAASCQKCLRAGGKHSDLENVGHTSRHHTFFEMLGNFSFGDYFKREAVRYAWELLVEVFRLPAERLWITVYEDDEEAERLWQDEVGVAKDRIVRLGVKDNFWQMADTGPCGPCSEVLIDQGSGTGCGRPECAVGCDCDRYLELWNLVFMQYDRDEAGNLNPLPRPSIDTGMGLERISAVLQGKLNNFDTDIFSETISLISHSTGVPYGESPESDVSIRVIADHARAAAFLLSDGLMPSNEGRGYVLKRIIRRASRHARLLGAEGPLLSEVLEAVVSTMGESYPELLEERARASKVLRLEEERFSRTLRQGMRILEDLMGSLRREGEDLIPGGEVFKLYDTFGFPLDLVRDMALDSGFHMDEEGFREAMQAQRERARASWVGEEEAISPVYKELLKESGNTEFLGHGTLQSESVVKAILLDGKVVVEAEEGVEAEVVLDSTPFYGESGGQSGDTGAMYSETVRLEVTETRKPVEGLISHLVKVKKGPLKVWTRLKCKVQGERRTAIMRNHTATHLLHAALRTVLGEHVKQAGSLVEPGRLRFDFTHFSAMTEEELSSVEELVNEKVMENLEVHVVESELEEAVRSGAVALFGEKYAERVRVVGIADFSKELCGGTHCRFTGEIGPFSLSSEGSVASGIRRIEALTGMEALKRLRAEREEIKRIGIMLKSPESPSERVRLLLEEVKGLEKEREKAKGAAIKDISVEIAQGARSLDGLRVVSHKVEGLGQKDLRGLADNVRDRLGSGVVVLASEKEGQAFLLAVVTGDLKDRYNAGRILKEVAARAGGSGGGKAVMAQGGTKDLARLDSALESVYDIVRGRKGS